MSSKFLIWGGNGWIGSMLCNLLREEGYEVIIGKARLQDYVGITKELEEHNPDFVLNCAGITGRPTIDWSEQNKQETFLINTVGTVNLADACWRKNIHMTNYATGCIYTYSSETPIGCKFSELDPPNFRGSTYSTSKVLAEELLAVYDNVLTLRIRMPISDDLHPKSLVTKLSKYDKLVDIPNSVTILPELLPISIKLTLDRKKGIYNFTNPGAISHNEIMMLYKKHIDPSFTWNNFTEEEQNAILKSKRSNCYLDTCKLEDYCHVTEIHQALDTLLQNVSNKLKNSLKN
jgi:3,5-epimerase/4-reductase